MRRESGQVNQPNQIITYKSKQHSVAREFLDLDIFGGRAIYINKCKQRFPEHFRRERAGQKDIEIKAFLVFDGGGGGADR